MELKIGDRVVCSNDGIVFYATVYWIEHPMATLCRDDGVTGSGCRIERPPYNRGYGWLIEFYKGHWHANGRQGILHKVENLRGAHTLIAEKPKNQVDKIVVRIKNGLAHCNYRPIQVKIAYGYSIQMEELAIMIAATGKKYKIVEEVNVKRIGDIRQQNA